MKPDTRDIGEQPKTTEKQTLNLTGKEARSRSRHRRGCHLLHAARSRANVENTRPDAEGQQTGADR